MVRDIASSSEMPDGISKNMGAEPESGDAIPASPGRVRADPERGLILVVDAAGRERPYLVTKAEALMVLVLSEARPAWITGAEMRRRDPRIYNPAVILDRLRGKGLPGFRVETDAGRRMRLVIGESGRAG